MKKSTKKSMKKMVLVGAAVTVMMSFSAAPAMADDPTGTKPPAQNNGGLDHLPGGKPTGDKPPTGTKPPVQDNGGLDHLPGGKPDPAKPDPAKPGTENKPGTDNKPSGENNYDEHKYDDYCSCWRDYFKPSYYTGSSYGDYYWDYDCNCWGYDYQPWYYWYSPTTIYHTFYGYCHQYFPFFFGEEKKGYEEEKGTENKPEGKQTPPTTSSAASS